MSRSKSRPPSLIIKRRCRLGAFHHPTPGQWKVRCCRGRRTNSRFQPPTSLPTAPACRVGFNRAPATLQDQWSRPGPVCAGCTATASNSPIDHYLALAPLHPGIVTPMGNLEPALELTGQGPQGVALSARFRPPSAAKVAGKHPPRHPAAIADGSPPPRGYLTGRPPGLGGGSIQQLPLPVVQVGGVIWSVHTPRMRLYASFYLFDTLRQSESVIISWQLVQQDWAMPA